MRIFTAAALIVAALPCATTAQTTSAPATTAAAKLSTEDTDIGTLLANPAAKAVLVKHIPAVAGNPQISMASSMTLRALQSYSPELTDEVLATIDADLAKVPAK